MIFFFAIILLQSIQQTAIPYLEEKQFAYELDYGFKSRPAPDLDKFDMSTSQLVTRDASMLPYVKMKIQLLVPPKDYTKYRLLDNTGNVIKSKKIKEAKEEFIIDMGFAADIKDRTGPYSYEIYLLDVNKDLKKYIFIWFSEDGTMFINDIKRGKI